MKYNPTEADWIDYLYGNMSSEQVLRFEAYLIENPEAQRKFESLQEIRKWMTSVEDKEVIAPPLFITNAQNSFWQFPYAKTILSVAASLLIIIVAGWLTNFHIQTDGNGIRFAFGEEKVIESVDAKPNLTNEEVQALINQSIASNATILEQKWIKQQEELKKSVNKNLARTASNNEKFDLLVQQVASASQTQVQAYMASMQQQNLKSMQEYLTLTSNDQKAYIEGLLVDFAKYLQQQRNDDLRLLQAKITDVEQNNNQFKAETEQILTSLISNNNGRALPTGIRN
jgi:Tfp pilus assembly protein PilE